MKHLERKDIQKIGNEILKHIKDVCDNHGIRFFLAYGTVLGAIRHKGFIPWDDDIDIYMYRKDYEKFKLVVEKYSSPYQLLDIETDSKYFLPQVKMMDTRTTMVWHVAKKESHFGVWVDIYVLDNVPDDNRELRHFQQKLNFLQRCFQHTLYRNRYTSFKSLLYNIVFCWTDLLGPRFFSKRMVALSKQYNSISTKRIAPSSFTASSREEAVLEKEIIGEGTISLFEGTEYLVPKQVDNYLKHFYGNYMELPPVEKRISNHTADFYLIDK